MSLGRKDTFRKKYSALEDRNKELIENIKDKADELLALLENIQSREMSLAITNLEQSVMWATKAVVLRDDVDKTLGN